VLKEKERKRTLLSFSFQFQHSLAIKRKRGKRKIANDREPPRPVLGLSPPNTRCKEGDSRGERETSKKTNEKRLSHLSHPSLESHLQLVCEEGEKIDEPREKTHPETLVSYSIF